LHWAYFPNRDRPPCRVDDHRSSLRSGYAGAKSASANSAGAKSATACPGTDKSLFADGSGISARPHRAIPRPPAHPCSDGECIPVADRSGRSLDRRQFGRRQTERLYESRQHALGFIGTGADALPRCRSNALRPSRLDRVARHRVLVAA